MHHDLHAFAEMEPGDRAQQQAAAHLHKAEREITWLRVIGLIGWAVVLHRMGFPFGVNAVWNTYFGGVAYTVLVHWRLRNPATIETTAWFATLGDPLLTFFMCLVTGGIGSVFFPFFYFTVLAAAFRFGVRETLGMLGFNGALIILLYGVAPVPKVGWDAVVLGVFYLGFAAVLGAMLAGWARDNLNLALVQSSALRLAHERSRELLHRLIDAQEDERKRVASDLHDRMGGRLFTLQQGLDQGARASAEDPAMQRQLATLAIEARACAADVRVLMNELRPTVLDDLGFYEALGEYVANMSEVVPFALKARLDPALRDWRSLHDAMLFRLVQEALLNVRKHTEARQVEIGFVPDAQEVVLTIADDGFGFDPGPVPVGHYGLLTMRERAEAIGGRLIITSELAHGTLVTVRLPRETPA